MNQQDRQAIDSIFTRLAEVEKTGPARDGEAEAHIRSRLNGQPGSAYYLAQTVMVQEQALHAAQQKIQALEQGFATPAASSANTAAAGASGLGYGFGRSVNGAASTPGTPALQNGVGAGAVDSDNQGAGPGQRLGFGGQGNGQSNNVGQQTRPAGGGFMAGAMQTALGVAGGVMLGNMLGGLFGTNAEASTPEEGAEASGQGAAAETDVE